MPPQIKEIIRGDVAAILSAHPKKMFHRYPEYFVRLAVLLRGVANSVTTMLHGSYVTSVKIHRLNRQFNRRLFQQKKRIFCTYVFDLQ